MKEKNLFRMWVIVALAATLVFLIVTKMQRQKYLNLATAYGFNSYWLTQMKTSELKTLYTYIVNYFSMNRKIAAGEPLDLAMLALAKKYPLSNLKYK